MSRRYLGLTTVIFGGLLTLSGCSYFHSTQTPNDNAIASAIEASLFQDPNLKQDNIQVVSQKGVVVLSGSVSSEAQKSQAEALANGVSGVKQVIDELTVNSSPSREATQANVSAPPAERPRQLQSRSSQTQQVQQTQQAQTAPPAAATSPAESASAAQQSSNAQPAQPQPVNIAIPAGTAVTVITTDALNSSTNHAGDVARASIASPVIVNGQEVIPQDANAQLQVVQAVSAGHIKGRSELQLKLTSISLNGTKYPVDASTYTVLGASRGTRSAETIGGGAALGALIGALAGHGKGAAIGAAVGAGAGTAVQMGTKAQQAAVPSETKINFTLRKPLTVTLTP